MKPVKYVPVLHAIEPGFCSVHMKLSKTLVLGAVGLAIVSVQVDGAALGKVPPLVAIVPSGVD